MREPEEKFHRTRHWWKLQHQMRDPKQCGHTRVCTCEHVYVSMCTCVYTLVCVHVCSHVCVQMCGCACECRCVHMCAHVRVCVLVGVKVDTARF